MVARVKKLSQVFKSYLNYSTTLEFKMGSTDLEKMREELKWVQIQEEEKSSFYGKIKAKGILGFLVPAGCLVTSGILFSGLYQMIQKNKKNQQFLMRCRVGAQGVTIILALCSIFAAPLQQSK